MSKQLHPSYSSDERGFWWEFEGDKGEPQINLHAAMRDYERVQREQAAGHSHINIPLTGEAEEGDADGTEEGAGGIGPGGGGTPNSDPGHGDQDSEGEGSDQDGRASGTDDAAGSSPAE